MQNTTAFLLSQLEAIAPVLIVYVGGMVLAAVWWGRGPRAAALAMAGLALSVIAALGAVFAHAWVIGNQGTAPVANLARMNVADRHRRLDPARRGAGPGHRRRVRGPTKARGTSVRGDGESDE